MASMRPHDHRHRVGSALVAAAQATLLKRGEQWTGMRASVFDALTGFDQPASAYAVTDKVSAVLGRRIAANSIYRILDLFVANNVALRVESANAYLANAHPECHHDCIFLICDACGRATHVDDDGVAATVRAAAMQTGFKPSRPVIEVRGKCATCVRQA